MRQTIKTRSFLLVSALVIIAVVTTVWRARSYFQDDKKLFLEESITRQTASLDRLVRERIDSLGRAAMVIKERHGQNQSASAMFADIDELLLVASIDKSNAQIAWSERNPSVAKSGTTTDIEAALARLTHALKNGDEVSKIRRLSYQDGRPLFALILPSEKGYLVSFINGSPFEAIVRHHKGAPTTGFVVDKSGLVLGHPLNSYTGVSFENHPVVSEIKTGTRKSAAGIYGDLEGNRIFARYQSIEGTGLFAIVSIPHEEVFGAYSRLLGPFGILLAGILLIAVSVTLAFSSELQDSFERLRRMAQTIKTGDKIQIEAPETKGDEIDQVAGSLAELSKQLEEREIQWAQTTQVKLREERLNSLNRLGVGIGSELKGSLSGILGHIQIMKEKSAGREDLKKHIEFIERETRRSREVIEDLVRFAGLEKVPHEVLDLYDVVVAGIEQVEHRIGRMGITLQKNLRSAPAVMGISHQMQQMIVSLSLFVAKRLESSEGYKHMTIALEQDGREAKLTIEADGIQISDQEREYCFDPFFIPKSEARESGLALSAAWGIVKSHGGSIEFGEGVGCRMIITLPVSEQRASRLLKNSPLQHLDVLEEVPASTGPKTPSILPDAPEVTFSVPQQLLNKDLELPVPPAMIDAGENIVRPPKLES